MAEWARRPLADVVELRRGFDLPHRDRRDGPYPVLSAGVTAGWHAEGPVSGPGFVIGRATNLGQPTWCETAFWPLNTTLYAANFKGNVARWVFHLFETLDLSGFDSGSVQPMLNRNYIAQVEVPVPPIPEQRAIAEVLGALDDKIAANTRLATTADALAASMLRAGLSSDVTPLAALATITMGSSPPGTSYNENGTGVPFFQGVRDFGFRSPRNRVWTTSPVRLARRGDTLLSVRAPVGQVNVAPTDLCIGRGLASVRSTLGRPWSLFHLLRAAPDVWAPYEAEGTVFGSINRDQLAGLMVPSVEVEAEARVEEVLATLEARLGAALDENLALAATRDTLLSALMSGTLRVRDAERAVEGAA